MLWYRFLGGGGDVGRSLAGMFGGPDGIENPPSFASKCPPVYRSHASGGSAPHSLAGLWRCLHLRFDRPQDFRVALHDGVILLQQVAGLDCGLCVGQDCYLVENNQPLIF